MPEPLPNPHVDLNNARNLYREKTFTTPRASGAVPVISTDWVAEAEAALLHAESAHDAARRKGEHNSAIALLSAVESLRASIALKRRPSATVPDEPRP